MADRAASCVSTTPGLPQRPLLPRHLGGRPGPVLLLLAAGLLPGCVTPAEPLGDQTAATAAATVAASVGPVGTPPQHGTVAPLRGPTGMIVPNGKYLGTFYTSFAGPFYVRFEAEPLDNGRAFKANTRPGIAWSKLSSTDASIGLLLAPFLFPSGMIVHMRTSMPGVEPPAPAPAADAAAATTAAATTDAAAQATDPDAPTPGRGYIGVATLAALRAKVEIPALGPGRVLQKDGKPIALFKFTADETAPAAGAGRGYSQLIAAMQTAAATRWYDGSAAPGNPAGAAFTQFMTDAQAMVADAQDDLEFLFSLGAAWRKQKDLPFPLLYRPLSPDDAAMMQALDKRLKPLDVKIENNLAILTATALTDVASIDAAFEELAKTPDLRGIILDLQNSPGVDTAALQIARWIIRRPTMGGIWFGSAARPALAAGTLQPRTVTISGPSDFVELDRTLEAEGAAAVQLEPIATSPFSRMPVAILISRRTVTTSETLTAVLKQHASERMDAADGLDTRRLRLFGEATGKRPQLTREVPLRVDPPATTKPDPLLTGWAVRMPAYDWRLRMPAAADPAATDPAATEPPAWIPIEPDESGSREEAFKAAKAFISEFDLRKADRSPKP
jgi:hypothetical protein